MKNYNISFIISTRNRADLLRNCLDALINQDNVEKDSYEIVVVDNGSDTNDTKHVVDSLQGRFKHMKYVYQEKLGLSIARNTGVEYADGDLICFLDDDTIPDKNYIREIIYSFKNHDIACLGGKIVAAWPQGIPPVWFDEKFGDIVGETSFGIESGFMKKDEFPFGGNIAFRKEIFQIFNGFNENLGRKGNNYITGEEMDLCYRLQENGYKFFYNHKAVVFHVVGENRASKKYFLDSTFGKGITLAYLKRNNKSFLIFVSSFFVKLFFVLFSYITLSLRNLSEKEKFKLKCIISSNLGYFYAVLLGLDLGDL